MIADSSEIKFECSQCGQNIAVDISGAGLSTQCPTCDNPLVVPSLTSLHHRNYGEDVLVDEARPAFEEDARLSAAEEQELRDELVASQRRVGESERALTASRRESARLQEQLDAAVEEGAGHLASGAAALAEMQGLQADRQQLKSDLAQSQQSAALTAAQLAEARAMISELGAGLEAAEENRAQWEQALAQAVERADASAAQMTARETELVEALAAARGGAEVLQRAHAGLRREFESAQAGFREAALVAEEKLAEAQRAIEAAEAERQSLAGRCEALHAEAEGLRHDLLEIHTGRELLELRDRFQALETAHQGATSTLIRTAAEAERLAFSEEKLRAELIDARQRGADAEHRADAATESALAQDNAVLRGIIERQKVVMGESFIELRRLKRARLVLRILYALVALALVGLAALAVDALPDAVKHELNEWFGL